MVYRQMAWYWNTADAYQLVARVEACIHTRSGNLRVEYPTHIHFFGKKKGCKLVVAGAEGG